MAAPRSGRRAGKTVITLALLAALRRRGIAVRAAKTGPDYIDPGFHAAATGAAGLNLDSWAMAPAVLDALMAHAAGSAEILVVEGVMGLFDGVNGPPGRCGTTADLAARWSCRFCWCSMWRDSHSRPRPCCGALRRMIRPVRIAGVILNRQSAASGDRRALVSDAIAAMPAPAAIPILPAPVPRDASAGAARTASRPGAGRRA